MILCSCHAVREREVDALVAGGCRSVAELGRITRAGTDCGSCARLLRAKLGTPDRNDAPVARALAAK